MHVSPHAKVLVKTLASNNVRLLVIGSVNLDVNNTVNHTVSRIVKQNVKETVSLHVNLRVILLAKETAKLVVK